MSECVRCGEREAVPGQLGDRCRDCLDELLEDVDVVDRDTPELELILSPVHGTTRRLRIREAVEPGVAFALEEATWTGCAFRAAGREQLDRVELDGDAWGEVDADGVAETMRGP